MKLEIVDKNKETRRKVWYMESSIEYLNSTVTDLSRRIAELEDYWNSKFIKRESWEERKETDNT